MARKFRITGPGKGLSHLHYKRHRSKPGARRRALSIIQNLRAGSRPNLEQLPPRQKPH